MSNMDERLDAVAMGAVDAIGANAAADGDDSTGGLLGTLFCDRTAVAFDSAIDLDRPESIIVSGDEAVCNCCRYGIEDKNWRILSMTRCVCSAH
jgi:hypothetical protein